MIAAIAVDRIPQGVMAIESFERTTKLPAHWRPYCQDANLKYASRRAKESTSASHGVARRSSYKSVCSSFDLSMVVTAETKPTSRRKVLISSLKSLRRPTGYAK